MNYMIELLKSNVPVAQKRKRTVFDLSGVAHQEHAFTRWYEYFLNKDENHGLHDLFLQTIIKLTGNKISINEFRVGREVQTKKGNFIDLLIYGKNEDEGKSIVIENKLNHRLDNDLLDYLEDSPGSDHNKIGVLLTLNPHYIPVNVKGKFINILHHHWLDAVVRNSKFLQLTLEQDFVLSNFNIAIKNLSKDLIMNEQILFFLNNIKVVNDVVLTREKTSNYIVSQIDSAAAQLGLKVGGTRSDFYRSLMIPQVPNIYYTILFHKLLDETQQIGIVLEISGIGSLDLDNLDIALEKDISVAIIKGMQHRGHAAGNWVHYLSVDYPVDLEIMGRLAEFIVSKINSEFSNITRKVVDALLKKASEL